MTQDPKKLQELEDRLDQLLRKQDHFQLELNRIKREIHGLRQSETPAEPQHELIEETAPLADPPPVITDTPLEDQPPVASDAPAKTLRQTFKLPSSGLDLEKFIGENLISKIGILITVIGVAFGAKYAIDHQLISPLTRIILGYLAGIGLMGLAMRLKTNYKNFSAVLLSGALAILYIITYFAYSYYGLFPQFIAFSLMVLFTAFTVLAAWHYDRQIIALMGLVGAYAVPFLLSEDSGQALVLFSYMAVINTGILVISFRKHWKALFHTAFWMTWLIFSWWMIEDYGQTEHFGKGMFFLTVFYLLFYATLLAYKLSKKESLKWGDILLLLSNTFIFFGFGYFMLEDHPIGCQLLGVFAVVNALLHFGVGMLIKRYELAERNLFYLVIGLVLVFLTIAIPIQLDGNWVTLLWAGEAALLFWIGRSRQLPAFEKLALPLIILAFFSLLQDWSLSYGNTYFSAATSPIRPVFNIHLLSSLLFTAAFAFMTWVRQYAKFPTSISKGHWLGQILHFAIPAIFIAGLYFSFNMEIEYYWQYQYNMLNRNADTTLSVPDVAMLRMKNIWSVYYSLFFWSCLSWLNILRIKDRLLAWINLGLNAFAILAFLVVCLYELSELRTYDVSNSISWQEISSLSYPLLRYLGFALVAALLYTTYRYQRETFVNIKPRWPFDALLHISLLWMTSAELIHWMELGGYENSYKLGLSILWGVYALFLIALGINQRKTYLRVGAIVLFAITLLKLFFYDIAHLTTMAKTIVLVSLGVLLLIISFLYNKFKDDITDEREH